VKSLPRKNVKQSVKLITFKGTLGHKKSHHPSRLGYHWYPDGLWPVVFHSSCNTNQGVWYNSKHYALEGVLWSENELSILRSSYGSL